MCAGGGAGQEGVLDLLGVDVFGPAEGAVAEAPRMCLYDGIRVRPKRLVSFRRS